MRHAWRPGFNPTGAFRVLINAVAIGIVSARERVGFSHGLPIRFEISGVTTDPEVIPHGHDEQRSSVCSRVKIGRRFPVHSLGGLRVLMHDFAVSSLTMYEKVERPSRQHEVSIATHGI